MKVAIWCRHYQNSVIGIGSKIPWHISSDFQRFKRVTTGKSIVAGQVTYESFPNRTLPNRKIYVLTFKEDYQVSDETNHFVVNDKSLLDNIKDDLFIVGGASIYRLFMSDEKTAPDCVIDCCYRGQYDTSLEGVPVHIQPCVDFMVQYYESYNQTLTEDEVDVTLWIKKTANVSSDDMINLWNRIADIK